MRGDANATKKTGYKLSMLDDLLSWKLRYLCMNIISTHLFRQLLKHYIPVCNNNGKA